jgi:hypothetical protein
VEQPVLGRTPSDLVRLITGERPGEPSRTERSNTTPRSPDQVRG